MSIQLPTAARPITSRIAGIGLVTGIVELTLITAYIHLTLGGLLFTLNAIGYAVLALAVVVASVAPAPLARFGWLPRIGLAGYTSATIGAYVMIGPYFDLGWIAKGIEVAILTLLVADLVRRYGSVRGLVRAVVSSLGAPENTIRRA